MTTEEKARAYDEAFENARQEYNTTENVGRKQWLEELFPELKEGEDEKIKKSLINYINAYGNGGDFTKEEYIAWLEKQGEPIVTIDVGKMVDEYAKTEQGDFGLPVACQIKAYRQGVNDVLRLSLNLERQSKEPQEKSVLEAKKVDLEKEIDKYLDDNFYFSETCGVFSEKTESDIERSDIEDVAKHFFELGLKAQKGE